ncbi:hypothetical protein MOMA_04405 [Moraxella macacae 0408225]|uniref:Metal-binding protein (DUF2387) n=1 Tax=Moraxella macacae 0408225 TaxID=1230338 RepID=L2F9B8_9GAMM|nr:YheV family putative metal-binding protein [Moraxella macacae]ELA09617.1 hypothetical protein MOMA_04405 [Moraxella macacae 0408225]
MRYQSGRPKRQFLAGVTCPKCSKMDTIVQIEVFKPMPDEYIECVACGHTERRPTPDELPIITQNTDATVGVVKFK